MFESYKHDHVSNDTTFRKTWNVGVGLFENPDKYFPEKNRFIHWFLQRLL